MKFLYATHDQQGFHYDIWRDETQVAFEGRFVVGQETMTDEEGEEVSRPVYAAEDYVAHFDWGNDVPQDVQMREMALLLQPPEIEVLDTAALRLG